MSSAELTSAERRYGQSCALRANLLAGLFIYILLGMIMQLFANDVLGFSARQIAVIMALIPLTALARLPLLGAIDRLGLLRTALVSIGARFVIILALILIPARMMTFPVFLILVTVFAATSRVGMGACWQPLMRNITTNEDRGRFFGRMRFFYTTITAIAVCVIPVLIGTSITEAQYKILLIIAAAGVLNQFYWARKIPEPERANDARAPGTQESIHKRLWRVLRTSPLMRRPLLVRMLAIFFQVPIYVVYLKKMINMPSNLVSVYIAMVALGGAASLLLWGKLADTIGFKPMLTGILILYMLVVPLQLLIVPLPPESAHTVRLEAAQAVGLGALLFYGFATGALVAGIGIAATSILHYYVRREHSLEAMNLWSFIFFVLTSLFAFFSGYLLQNIAMPRGSVAFCGGVLHFDWIKGYLIFVGIPVQVLMIALLRKLPNARPYFGLGDFFSSLSPVSVRSMLAQRGVYHEDERRRLETARWLGAHASPMSIDPLVEMLQDPAFDVKVEAIRGLALTGSELAGEKLLEILEDDDKRQLADHAAWALGQLRYGKAFDALVERIGPAWPRRIRAMAARALGKIGDRRAVEPLVALLERETESKYVISSACRALLRLDDGAHAELVFDKLGQMTRREASFELMDSLCSKLEITNEWLLRFVGNETAQEALLEYIEHRSPVWRKERGEICAALKDERLDAVKLLFRIESARGPFAGKRILRALGDSLDKIDSWEPLAVLAAAWLLLHKRTR